MTMFEYFLRLCVILPIVQYPIRNINYHTINNNKET